MPRIFNRDGCRSTHIRRRTRASDAATSKIGVNKMNTLDTMKMALAMLEKCNMNGWMLADYEDEMYQAISALKQAIEECKKAKPKEKNA
jgi:hypothetical protein